MRNNWIPSIKACALGVLLFCAFPCLATPAKHNAVVVGRVLDAETGQEIPCTVTIQTSDQRIVFDNPSFTDGFRSVGHFEKEVPSGETVITVSQGFDYRASQQQVDLQPGQRVPLVFRLRAQAALRHLGWYCGDNHVHMIHGPRKPAFALDFPYLALAARGAGLDYMSVAQNWNLPPSETTPTRLSELCNSASTPDFILAWNMEEPKNYWRGDVTHCLGPLSAGSQPEWTVFSIHFQMVLIGKSWKWRMGLGLIPESHGRDIVLQGQVTAARAPAEGLDCYLDIFLKSDGVHDVPAVQPKPCLRIVKPIWPNHLG